tara:strand:+ start:288 stop:539 length:252 start_codon:yes stop_codon:yes gene_type:complete
VAIADGKIQATETVLTRADTEKATREMHRRMVAIGVPDVHVCAPNPKRFKRLMREQNARRKADRALTVGEVAEIVEELNKDAS